MLGLETDQPGKDGCFVSSVKPSQNDHREL
jgi:hypothetical protein